MANAEQHIHRNNDELRKYVLKRDNMCCQWPGCGNTLKIDVLFLVENENGAEQGGIRQYKNGVTLCAKHLEIVNLHDKTFGPLIFDLIQLVEFERELQKTEMVYRGILNK